MNPQLVAWGYFLLSVTSKPIDTRRVTIKNSVFDHVSANGSSIVVIPGNDRINVLLGVLGSFGEILRNAIENGNSLRSFDGNAQQRAIVSKELLDLNGHGDNCRVTLRPSQA